MEPKLSQLEDRELISLFATGEGRAFDALARRYRGKTLALIYQMTRDRDMSRDIYQDVLIKIMDLLQSNKYKEEGKFLPWCLRIARNLTLDYLRKEKRTRARTSDVSVNKLENAPTAPADVEVAFMKKENKAQMRALLQLLPQKQKQTLILRYYNDMTFREIAETTNVSINTALGRVRYAMEHLRKLAAQNSAYSVAAVVGCYLC